MRNWLRSPSRTADYLWKRAGFALGWRPSLAVIDGFRLRLHPLAVAPMREAAMDGEQLIELREFREHCGPGLRLLDLGAHYGLFSLFAAHLGAEKVLAVEASPAAAAVLEANVALNGFSSRVEVSNCAVGPEDGSLPMLDQGPFTRDYFGAAVESHHLADAKPVPCLSLASLIEAGRPTHVKVDIESFEYEVIEAGREALRRARPVLFLELHGDYLRTRKKDPARVLDFLSEAGYRRYFSGGFPVDAGALAAAEWNVRLVCRFEA